MAQTTEPQPDGWANDLDWYNDEDTDGSHDGDDEPGKSVGETTRRKRTKRPERSQAKPSERSPEDLTTDELRRYASEFGKRNRAKQPKRKPKASDA
jgi:hypothetical protein